MKKTKRQPPVRVFTVVCRDGRYVCVSAELTERRGSWWYVTHKDGSVTRHNGGRPWRRTVPEAWFSATRKVAWAFWRDGVAFALKEKRPGGDARDADLERLFECLWDCAFGFGQLTARVNDAAAEGSRP